jgi:hypothetical protein
MSQYIKLELGWMGNYGKTYSDVDRVDGTWVV